MFFLTAAECIDRLEFHGLDPACAEQQAQGNYRPSGALTFRFDRKQRSIVLARKIVDWIGPAYRCLFWITEHGAWPSSENEHLYYRLRSSYGDARSLVEAPGHDFLSYERADLVTYLSLAIEFGWGGFLLPSKHQSAKLAFLSHDEWFRIERPLDADKVLAEASALGLSATIE